MELLGQRVVARFQLELRAQIGFLDVGVHFQVQGVGVFGKLGAEPGKHGRQVRVLLLPVSLEQDLEVFAAQRAPDAPAECLRGTNDGEMDEAADEEALPVDGAKVIVEEGPGETAVGPGNQVRPSAGFSMVFSPVEGLGDTEIQAGSGVPLVAVGTLPSHAGQVVQRNGGVGVADAGVLVTLRAEQHYLGEAPGFIGPTIVGGADDLTVVAPGVGERVVFTCFFAIEAETCSIPGNVDAHLCALCFAVEIAMNCAGHASILRALSGLVKVRGG